jgi:glutathione S-transferase
MEDNMELYFSPLACSMATRISLYEAGASARYIEVDPKTKRTAEGDDFFAVNPLGLVPVVRTEDGELVTENAAILQYVADQHKTSALAPEGGMARTRLQQWLCFIGTELHKAVFIPLLNRKTPEDTRMQALEYAKLRLDYLNKYLEGREFLLDRFSVADAYLFTVLNWTRAVTAIDLAKWPAIKAYVRRLRERPSIARALREEVALYQAEQARHKAA